MEFNDVVDKIKQTIPEFESFIQRNPNLVLSEADFERYLSNAISEKLMASNNDEHVVHNQISHYPDSDIQYICTRDSQVDILIMKDADIRKESRLNKGFVYLGDSVAIELKYYRDGQSVSSIVHDLEKSETLLVDNHFKCAFFVVALFEDFNERQKSLIKEYFNQYSDKKGMFTFDIYKKKQIL